VNEWIEHPWEREDREIREALEKKDAEIERLKVLVNRAASSLVIWASKDSFATQELIKELRKAAE
jgi:hypothetical protein